MSESTTETKITKEEFDSLYDENVTVKAHKHIMRRIDDRFKYIMRVLDPKAYDRWNNFDYSNGGYDNDGDLLLDGEFDLFYYKEEIDYIGESTNSTYFQPDNSTQFPDSHNASGRFPTRWLWEDFEEEYKITVQKIKDERAAKSEALRQERLQKEKEKKEMDSKMWESIKSKLTKEELYYLQGHYVVKG